jgi:Bacterial capsule synthesis protein PGA_cap
VVARAAIGGDFLPAGAIVMESGSSWAEQADRLASHFEDVDTSFVNLEACLPGAGLVPRSLVGLGQIVAAPAEVLDYLKAIRCQAVGIANNHSYDFGSPGVVRTRNEISRHGMFPLGAGRTMRKPPEIFIWRGPGNLRVGFWAAAKATSDPATKNHPGTEPADAERGAQALEAMRNQGATFFVALLHAGCMRVNRPDPEDVELMESLAQAGFDIVAASHSHRIAGYKRLSHARNRESFCFFGLGSLVSGYINSPLEREGLIVVAGLDAEGKLASIEIRAVVLEQSGFGAIPSVVSGTLILDRFLRLSAEFNDGSFEANFYSEVSRGLGELYIRDVRAAFRSAGVRGLAVKASRLRLRHVKRLLHRVTG